MIRSTARRLAATVLAAAAITGGTAAVTAPSAQAASGVSFCFVWGGGTAYANQPVYLMNSAGQSVRAGKTNGSGCGVFTNTPTSSGMYVRAHTVLNEGSYHSVYAGNSRYAAPAGTGGANLGTGYVGFVYAY